jgi:2-polyprenyl-3-methyl-5-hydroxy-6-metoxy-1,4-benzoquinol methylase
MSESPSESISTSWRANNAGEYLFENAEHDGSHSYLQPSLKELIGDIPAGAVVMDVGCGNGSMLASFREQNWHLRGIDFSTTGITHARAAFPFIDFMVADGASENFSHPLLGKCDLVLTTEVIEHVYLPRRFAKNCFSLLRPGGMLIVTTPHHGYFKNLCLALSGQLDHHFHALWDYGHIKFWSRKTLTTLLEEAGFRGIEFRGSGRMPYCWKSMILRCYKPIENNSK